MRQIRGISYFVIYQSDKQESKEELLQYITPEDICRRVSDLHRKLSMRYFYQFPAARYRAQTTRKLIKLKLSFWRVFRK